MLWGVLFGGAGAGAVLRDSRHARGRAVWDAGGGGVLGCCLGCCLRCW